MTCFANYLENLHSNKKNSSKIQPQWIRYETQHVVAAVTAVHSTIAFREHLEKRIVVLLRICKIVYTYLVG